MVFRQIHGFTGYKICRCRQGGHKAEDKTRIRLLETETGDSNSTVNQKKMLEDYATNNGYRTWGVCLDISGKRDIIFSAYLFKLLKCSIPKIMKLPYFHKTVF